MVFNIGLFITVIPLLSAVIAQIYTPNEFFIYFFGVGTVLMGGGLGLAVGHILYREEKGAKKIGGSDE